MNASHGQEISIIIYITYIRTSHGRWFAPHRVTTRFSPKAWPSRRGCANARPPQRPATSCGGGLTGCRRCNTDDTTVCFADYCSMLTRVLCVLFFFAAGVSGQRKSRSRALGSGVCDCAARTPHSTPHARTAQRAPVPSIDSLRMTAVEHTRQ